MVKANRNQRLRRTGRRRDESWSEKKAAGCFNPRLQGWCSTRDPRTPRRWLHREDDKFQASQNCSMRVWVQIKRANPRYPDLMLSLLSEDNERGGGGVAAAGWGGRLGDWAPLVKGDSGFSVLTPRELSPASGFCLKRKPFEKGERTSLWVRTPGFRVDSTHTSCDYSTLYSLC